MGRGQAITSQGNYPPEWLNGTRQKELYAQANWRCEHCGMEFVEGSTLAKTARNRKGKPIILTVHHLTGNKSDCSWRNCLVCCQRCHLHIQAVWSPNMALPPQWEGVPKWLIARGLSYQPSPQGRLW